MVLPGVACAKGSSAHQPLSCGITAGAGSFPRALRSHHLKVGVSMKKLVSVLLCILLLALPSAAHPGRTDSDGGHTDHSTGEYHYHHGQPAHQHTGGDCPYNWRTTPYYSKSSSSSSSSSAPKSETKTYYASAIKAQREAAEKEARKNNDKKALKTVFAVIYFLIVAAVAFQTAKDESSDKFDRAVKSIKYTVMLALMMSPLWCLLAGIYMLIVHFAFK